MDIPRRERYTIPDRALAACQWILEGVIGREAGEIQEDRAFHAAGGNAYVRQGLVEAVQYANQAQ